MTPNNITFILHKPQLSENIGACARAMKNFNFQKLTVINEDGMQYILINIGGRSYKYLIDTGASDMTINNTMKETFVRKGILKKSDFRSVKYKVANGETITMQRGILKSMKINNNTFYNVNVAVGNSNTPLLLGKSFLNRYDWRLNSDELELNNK